MTSHEFVRRLFAEALGTMFLLVAVVGSGIMAVRLSGGNNGIALLANSIATGGALVALIASLGSISGAHINPAVTLFELVRRNIGVRLGLFYIPVQIAGGIAGVILAHAMFAEPLIQESFHARDTAGEFIGEIVATFGLLLTIWGTARTRPEAVPYAVAAYITGAYWFTSSTSFANPAVTIARSLTDTFAGIAPASVLPFLAAQTIAVALALGAVRILAGSTVHAVASEPSLRAGPNAPPAQGDAGPNRLDDAERPRAL